MPVTLPRAKAFVAVTVTLALILLLAAACGSVEVNCRTAQLLPPPRTPRLRQPPPIPRPLRQLPSIHLPPPNHHPPSPAHTKA